LTYSFSPNALVPPPGRSHKEIIFILASGNFYFNGSNVVSLFPVIAQENTLFCGSNQFLKSYQFLTLHSLGFLTSRNVLTRVDLPTPDAPIIPIFISLSSHPSKLG